MGGNSGKPKYKAENSITIGQKCNRLVLNGKGLTLFEIDTASALFIRKFGINALKQNYVFQEFPGCLKGIEIKVL